MKFRRLEHVYILHGIFTFLACSWCEVSWYSLYSLIFVCSEANTQKSTIANCKQIRSRQTITPTKPMINWVFTWLFVTLLCQITLQLMHFPTGLNNTYCYQYENNLICIIHTVQFLVWYSTKLNHKLSNAEHRMTRFRSSHEDVDFP